VRLAYRIAFAIGVAAIAVGVGAGFAQAWRRTGRPPGLLVDPLVAAQERFAGRDAERWTREARSLTAIQPYNPAAFLALGRALSDQKRIGPAIRAYETALARGPVPPVAHAQLARLYYRHGDLDAARAQARLAQGRGVALSDEFQRAIGLRRAPRGRP
jgi:cytochrome c-type biogenesis protein CcmH/NrfG